MGVVTGHLPLKDVAGAISQQKVYSKIRLMHEALKLDFGIERPKIAVLGLNPHAGDHGLIGKEDSERIQKAVEQAFNNKMMVLGPFPADGFFQSGQFVEFDGILAMYHDQGLIPFKLVSGFEGTNYTAGLPVIRTSPDHGVPILWPERAMPTWRASTTPSIPPSMFTATATTFRKSKRGHCGK